MLLFCGWGVVVVAVVDLFVVLDVLVVVAVVVVVVVNDCVCINPKYASFTGLLGLRAPLVKSCTWRRRALLDN